MRVGWGRCRSIVAVFVDRDEHTGDSYTKGAMDRYAQPCCRYWQKNDPTRLRVSYVALNGQLMPATENPKRLAFLS